MAKRRLTDQQKARIANIQEKRRQNMAARAEFAIENNQANTEQGRVVVRHGQNLVIETQSNHLIHCLLRQNIGETVCGDRVIWQPTGDKAGVVVAIQARNSVLSRPDYSGRSKPLAANISQILVVLAPNPAPSGYLIDQYLVAAEQIGVQTRLLLNKCDLLHAEDPLHEELAMYRSIGYETIEIAAKSNFGLDQLNHIMRDQTSILVGQSGVGKSSIVKALLPDQEIQVGRLSQATGQGKHTTSAATLYRLVHGGELIDSPGVRSFRLSEPSKALLEHGFRDLAPFFGHCRFADCAHETEPGCAIQTALKRGQIQPKRLANFQQMLKNLPTASY